MQSILIIEDNDDIRENIAEILDLGGYQTLTAPNGKIGIEKAQAAPPDLVICDIMMPVLDGYSVLHIFNRTPALQHIPFIFLTAKAERSDFRKGMELGADDYLTKPFDDSELLTAVERRLQRFAQMQPGTTAPAHSAGEELPLTLQEVRETAGLESLTAERKVHTIRKKQLVYSEGDEPIRLYLIRSGRVKTFRTSAEGKELILRVCGPGDFFGYRALFTETEYEESAEALEDTDLVYIPKEEFLDLVHRNPTVSHRFVQLLASRVADQEEQLMTMAYNSLRRRVADQLIRLYDQQGKTSAEAVIRFTREDLASMIGTAPESLIRTLSEFKQDGLIDIAGPEIRLLQPERLRTARW